MLAVLPGIWEVSGFAILHCHLYLTDELREDSSALPTIIIVITPLTALMKDQVLKKIV